MFFCISKMGVFLFNIWQFLQGTRHKYMMGAKAPIIAHWKSIANFSFGWGKSFSN
jgi:hypothetical protein